MKNLLSPALLSILLFGVTLSAQETLEINSLAIISSDVMDSKKSILSNTETASKLSTLLTALKASNLDDILSYSGQFTVFAPSNLAFEKLSQITIDRLLAPENKKELYTILSGHIIAGKISASNMLKSMCRGNGKASFTTIQGEKIIATMKGIDIILTDQYGNRAKIMTADSNQSNGVIHEVDSVFMPTTTSL